eukprot:CAMPEP_0113238620 /NCGR_PEP_ID=MMETSP0008_2-20120614/5245_1 /TAXON_ID=97485 /ORGANISM="Prymnesium parvum" /LENGTH=247 /DNA_ID=CAMNT_0000085743 /DNA_START=507 /DNA_END=1247 /DNA_ORIENTATION=- /assembly_acc=CAM_ASM_000153
MATADDGSVGLVGHTDDAQHPLRQVTLPRTLVTPLAFAFARGGGRAVIAARRLRRHLDLRAVGQLEAEAPPASDVLPLLRREVRSALVLIGAHGEVGVEDGEAHLLVTNAAAAEAIGRRGREVVAPHAHVHLREAGGRGEAATLGRVAQRDLVVRARVAEHAAAEAAVALRDVLVLRAQLDLADGAVDDVVAGDPVGGARVDRVRVRRRDGVGVAQRGDRERKAAANALVEAGGEGAWRSGRLLLGA